MSKQFYVYILSNKPNGTLYTGVTSNLPQQIQQHRNSQFDGTIDRKKESTMERPF
ncbi:MAG: GIY-YIG nuclease family protein [Bacteroidetes bacterium]|nr:GIY-YIG nuclease family protein [Bacteroidota bacterium]